MTAKITVLLAEDHAIVRQGLRALLDREGFDVVGEAVDGQEAARLAVQVKPDIALLDIGMPTINGVEAVAEIRHSSPKTRAIILTRYDDDQHVLAAFRSGARGYVLKAQAGFDLIQAIREVHDGRIYLSPGISGAVVDAFLSKADGSSAGERLSARERQVLQLIAEGKATKEVATILGISVKTAESHRTRLMQKLDIHATAGLVRYAIRQGVIEP